MMRVFCATMVLTLFATGMAASSPAAAADTGNPNHRYLVERTFPAGAIDGVDAAAKAKVNENNAKLDVGWEKSYMSPDKTKLYCVYTGPSEQAVREAARVSGLPLDNMVEIPVDIKAEPKGAVHEIAPGNQRFLVKRAGSAAVNGADDPKFGVKLLTSYGAADASYWVYEAPSEAAIQDAAKASGADYVSIALIPGTLYPY